MKSHHFNSVLLACALAATSIPALAQQTSPAAPPMMANSSFSDAISAQIMAQFATEKLLATDFAWTLIDLADPKSATTLSYRGDEPIYPASVVKLFYLAAAENQLEQGQLQDSPELRRAMRDMIVDSSNDATALVLDSITQTTGGPELSPAEFAVWAQKRNGINRYFGELGYQKLNVNQKPWNEGPYGREKQFVSSTLGGRNKLTTDATAALIAQVGQQKWISSARSAQMRALLKRDPQSPDNPESQVVGFIGSALQNIPGAAQWSKAGWTSATRHDSAYVELPVSPQFPRGARFALAVFTENHAGNSKILPALARLIIDRHFGAPAKEKNGVAP